MHFPSNLNILVYCAKEHYKNYYFSNFNILVEKIKPYLDFALGSLYSSLADDFILEL